jgi:replicative superfamily II helicase
MNLSDRPMTKAEREDLIRLVKQRERVAKTAAEQRSAAMLAEFELQISTTHKFNTNAVWSAAVEAASAAAKACAEKIEAESDRLGIPKEFQPRISFGWAARGEAQYLERRTELRRVAKAEIDAIEKVARVQIETQSVQAQTEIIANGLNSEAAIAFLNRLPAIESMMPPLSLGDIQAKLAAKMRESGRYQGPRLLE